MLLAIRPERAAISDTSSKTDIFPLERKNMQQYNSDYKHKYKYNFKFDEFPFHQYFSRLWATCGLREISTSVWTDLHVPAVDILKPM
jgi:hypothetical protein